MPLSAADITEIEQLVAAHYHHYDRRDPEPFADTFTEDGVLDLNGRRHEGRDALAAWAETLNERHGADRFRHWVNNLWIEGEGDEAELRCYLVMFDNTGDGRVTLIGQYDDRLRREDGKWKFSLRRFVPSGGPASPPMTLPAANPPPARRPFRNFGGALQLPSGPLSWGRGSG